MFAGLPERIQERAREAYKTFLANQNHPSLRNHTLADSDKGRHRNSSRSVTITMQYRAIYVVDDDTNVWYWIGSHTDYNNFIGYSES
jgi:hypothetical protein